MSDDLRRIRERINAAKHRAGMSAHKRGTIEPVELVIVERRDLDLLVGIADSWCDTMERARASRTVQPGEIVGCSDV